MAMDYLPDTTKILIEKDIKNGHQVNEQKENAVSVKVMLASILGLGDEEGKVQSIPLEPIEPITTVSLTPSPIETEDLVTPAFNKSPLPPKKPIHIAITQEIIDVIYLQLDEQIIANVKKKTQRHAGTNHSAEISLGPIAHAENMQIASLLAMAMANSIGKSLKDDFIKISIRFDPLQPTGTLKIVIKGKKHNA
ncbi:MAG: hypothetical protein COA45_11345 [Zetaproteobacteria bacterium]|nr:MAG: hypothetical protein COA45_11345 [Zetaproteobacteria bacterium]